MKRCSKYVSIPKTGLDEFTSEGERRVYCARIDGHSGEHSYYHNGEKITQAVGFVCDICGEKAFDGIKQKKYEDEDGITTIYYCLLHYNLEKEKT